MRTVMNVQKVNGNCWEAADSQELHTACSPFCLRAATSPERIQIKSKFHGTKQKHDMAKKGGKLGTETLVGRHFFSVCGRKLLSLASCGVQYITGAQSEPSLKLVLTLGKGRLIKASLAFPMTLSCVQSLPRAVSHPALLAA